MYALTRCHKQRHRIPLGHFAVESDVTDAGKIICAAFSVFLVLTRLSSVLFLLSDKARMVTGVTLPVDGGFLAAGITAQCK